MLEMADIRDVADISYLVSEPLKIAEQYVERDRRTGMAEMGVTIDCRAAYVHADMSLLNRTERLFGACQRVVKRE